MRPGVLVHSTTTLLKSQNNADLQMQNTIRNSLGLDLDFHTTPEHTLTKLSSHRTDYNLRHLIPYLNFVYNV